MQSRTVGDDRVVVVDGKEGERRKKIRILVVCVGGGWGGGEKKTRKAVKNPFGNIIIIGTGDNPASDGREHNNITVLSQSLSRRA